MAIDYHRHCQKTILSANGTASQNGASWNYIDNLKYQLENLPSDWIVDFKDNKTCITQDFASILKILNQSIGNINSQITNINSSLVKKININGEAKSPLNGVVYLGTYLPLSGGTMGGYLTLNSDPTLDMHATTKKYVDDQIAPKGNGTVTGINVNGRTESPNQGIVDIGNVVSSIKINGDTKIPNENGLVDLGSVLTEYVPSGIDTIYRYQSNANENGEYSWFEIWPDGWCRQGGYSNSGLKITSAGGYPSHDVDLPVRMSNTNYTCLVSGCYTNDSLHTGDYVIRQNGVDKVTVQFDSPGLILAQESVDTNPFHWTAEGYRDASVSIETLQSTYGESTGNWSSSTIGVNGFDPSKFHTVFFNPGNATSIEFTSKSLYEGSKFGRLPTYTVNGQEMNTWYEDSGMTQMVLNTTIFNKTNDIELYNSTTTNSPETGNSSPLCFTAQEANSSIQFNGHANNTQTLNLEYKLEGSTNNEWTRYTGQTITLANVNDKMYMRATSEGNITISDEDSIYQFMMTGKIAASGNIQTLLDQTGNRMDVQSYCYYGMFINCTSLTEAPELPAPTLATKCYTNMFNGCTSLTAAPELPATTLAEYCYRDMFCGCTSLTQSPELPATTLADRCYYEMFSGCTSLIQAPELPATTLANGCYLGMFINCTSLTEAPELPATTLGQYCYFNIFNNCPKFSTVKMKSSMAGIYNQSTHGNTYKTVEYVL